MISVLGVSKTYKRFRHPGWRAWNALGLPVPNKFYDELVVINNINLEVKKGEKVALLGRNGAGKTTLLRLIAGKIRPTKGSIYLSGKLQVLMELGTGFHPDFTGLENIRAALTYQGILGSHSKQYINDIIDFTELEGFISRPVREYSAGMYARLAFGVATTLRPEVLIIDEILSAGDAYFIGKCIQRMKALTSEGTTILFVSHDLSSVQLICERGIWIEKGKIKKDGNVLSVSKAYLASIREDEELRTAKKTEMLAKHLMPEDRYGDGGIQITDLEFQDKSARSRYTLISGEEALAIISFYAFQPVLDPVVVITIYRPDGTCALQVASNQFVQQIGCLNAHGKIYVYFNPLYLGPGDYVISVALFKDLNLASRHEPQAYDLHDRCYALKILPPLGIGIDIGIVNQPATWKVISNG